MPNLLLATFYFFIYYPFHVENLIGVLLIINRLTSILFPLEYEKIWKKPRMIAAILLSCLAPLIITIHIFQYKVYLKEVKSNGFILAYAALTGTNLIGRACLKFCIDEIGMIPHQRWVGIPISEFQLLSSDFRQL
uniref:Serpentine receptor class gamma n=1 Tax=Meloidogyne incognita TaxID=6306 RepID=A0A914LMY0_MELIC